MRATNLPSVAKTVEWIEKNHTCREGRKLKDYCSLCGGTFPCAGRRMATEIRRLWSIVQDEQPRKRNENPD